MRQKFLAAGIVSVIILIIMGFLPFWRSLAIPVAAWAVPVIGTLLLSSSWLLIAIRSLSPPIIIDQPGWRDSLSLAVPVQETANSDEEPGMSVIMAGGGAVHGARIGDNRAIVVPVDAVEHVGGGKVVLIYSQVTPVDIKTLFGLSPATFEVLLGSAHTTSLSTKRRTKFSWLNTLVEGEDGKSWERKQRALVEKVGSGLGDLQLDVRLGQDAANRIIRNRMEATKRRYSPFAPEPQADKENEEAPTK